MYSGARFSSVSSETFIDETSVEPDRIWEPYQSEPVFTSAEMKRKKKQSDIIAVDPNDTYGDDAAEQKKLEAIAKAFEEKYAPRLKSKRACDRLSDLVDLGDGYDESDNFIDNSEAYDELVPACMTTKLGGFYINSGHLDFKYISDDSSEEFQINNSVKKRKVNRIESDSESEEEQQKKGPQKKKFKDGVDVERRKRKKLMVGPDGERIKMKRGRKPLDDKLKKKKNSPTVAELLKQQTASISIMNGGVEDLENEAVSKPMEKSSIESTFEAVLGEAMGDDSGSRDGNDKKPSNPDAIIPLPSDLPASLTDIIEQIKQEARESREGKCKFFSGNVNKMLLDIEIGSRQMAFGHRTSIYTHLSSFLPCSKETLIKRAKKLRLGQQDDQLRKPLRKLKEAVDNIMPILQERYETEHQKALQMRSENKDKDGDNGVNSKEYASTESDEEDNKNQDATNKKRIMGPRKKFEWTENIRGCLYDVVRVKMQMFSVSKVRAQTAEEYLRAFLDVEVKHLWPQGWMQTRMLFKQSRSVHANWTNPNKTKKAMLTAKAASPTALSIPVSRDAVSTVSRDIVSKEPCVIPVLKKTKDVIEIVGSSGEEEKVANGADNDSDCMKLEDYITNEDVDHLLSSIERHIPSLLDYADKSPAPATSSASTTVKPATLVSQPKHSTSLTTDSSARLSETHAHNLVADMLQKPLPTKTKPASIYKPTAVVAGSKDSPFMAEFQKHLSATASTRDELPSSIPTSELLSTPRLQSMLTSPLTTPLTTAPVKHQSSGSKQYEHFLKKQNYLSSDQLSPKVMSSQQGKPVSQTPAAAVNIIESRKVDSSHTKLDRGSPNSINKEAVKQIHQRLMSLAGSGKMSGLVKDGSQSAMTSHHMDGRKSLDSHKGLVDSSMIQQRKSLDSHKGLVDNSMIQQRKSLDAHKGLVDSSMIQQRKSLDSHKGLVDSAMIQQMFKQPLPASTASQMRLSPQQTKTVQGGGMKSQTSSALKTEMHLYPNASLHRQPTQPHQRVQNIGQNQQGTNRQPSMSQVSRNSLSSASNRQSSPYMSVASPTSSVSQVHANSLLSPTGNRQPIISHGSPSKLSPSDSRNSPGSRLSPHSSPTSSNSSMMSQIREQSNTQAFLSKVIESELKAVSCQQTVKISPPNRNTSQSNMSQSKPQVIWQTSQTGRVPAFNTAANVSKSLIGQSIPGYQGLKLSSSGTYSVVSSSSLPQQSPSLVSGSRSSHSQSAHSKAVRQGSYNTQSPLPLSTQVTMPGQQPQVTLQAPSTPQIPGLPPVYSSSHNLLSPSSPLYGQPPFTDSTHSSQSSHGY